MSTKQRVGQRATPAKVVGIQAALSKPEDDHRDPEDERRKGGDEPAGPESRREQRDPENE